MGRNNLVRTYHETRHRRTTDKTAANAPLPMRQHRIDELIEGTNVRGSSFKTPTPTHSIETRSQVLGAFANHIWPAWGDLGPNTKSVFSTEREMQGTVPEPVCIRGTAGDLIRPSRNSLIDSTACQEAVETPKLERMPRRFVWGDGDDAPASRYMNSYSTTDASGTSSLAITNDNFEKIDNTMIQPEAASQRRIPSPAASILSEKVVSIQQQRDRTLELLQQAVMTNQNITPDILKDLQNIGDEDLERDVFTQMNELFRDTANHNWLKPLLSEENWSKFHKFQADVSRGSQETLEAGFLRFHRFMELPPELREHIYEDALCTGKVINPHLCDARSDGQIKFHDDSQGQNHCAISDLLGVTRVSKQLRAESLPCFYSANTFTVGHDTATYFSRLEHLGRFHMIRHVRFEIIMRREIYAVQTLQQMNKHIQDMAAYERDIVAPTVHARLEARPTDNHQTHKMLTKHPMYIGGGVQFLAKFTCLRMLTSRFTENPRAKGAGRGYATELVLPIPRAEMFDEYSSLKWFPAVCHGLGIHLRFLEGHELSYSEQNCIGVTWHQQYQKKNFADQGDRGTENVDVKTRTLMLFPHMQGDYGRMETEGGSMGYYRVSCGRKKLEWFRVIH